ncbi:nucleotide exchange factor GrpE [Actinopolymorpha cephalotaxi]|uniref:Protein GrpE n=1 Tax=Actinopolymorpha cephalotaxi TaxID=504797 RepID=A0ABX2S647_9ACTN|nr:nucleotide exchange factor GrpE [Actinopolymorpha cephalotaxi]NYH83802.1 molecular chaperone GrpE [Actinopolymorpha cephalotaxi]
MTEQKPGRPPDLEGPGATETDMQNANEQPGPPGRDDALVEAQARAADFEDRWRRALADADNQRKRQAHGWDRQRAQVTASQAAQWLPVVDNLDRAVAHAQAVRPEEKQDLLLEGVRAVLEQAVGVLAALGYPRRDDEVGAVFDPARHEAVATVPSAEVPAGTVLDVVSPGYGEGERQLRPAGVVVATKAA